jgi:hypothetical protein
MRRIGPDKKIIGLVRMTSFSFLISLTTPSAAQNITAGDLPPAISAAIRKQPQRTLLPINGDERFDIQIVKADEIVFQPGGKITLLNVDGTEKRRSFFRSPERWPYRVIAARKLKFLNPSILSSIKKDQTRIAKAGQTGWPGQDQRPARGEVNRRGNDGAHGGNALEGGNGESFYAMPHIYIVVGEIVSQRGRVNTGELNLQVLFPGYDGGNGGQGGAGGDGGNGAPGKRGASTGDCTDGPGAGGTGGNAGRGGRGGNAGSGESGANITLVATAHAYEVLSFAKYDVRKGEAGSPGAPGSHGKVGKGGPGGRQWFTCGSGPKGADGSLPTPLNNGPGKSAKDGNSGSIKYVILPSINHLFR